eukprot:1904748-Amphidinium_carterae.1
MLPLKLSCHKSLVASPNRGHRKAIESPGAHRPPGWWSSSPNLLFVLLDPIVPTLSGTWRVQGGQPREYTSVLARGLDCLVFYHHRLIVLALIICVVCASSRTTRSSLWWCWALASIVQSRSSGELLQSAEFSIGHECHSIATRRPLGDCLANCSCARAFYTGRRRAYASTTMAVERIRARFACRRDTVGRVCGDSASGP